jgi:hypothetical protein
MANESSVTVRFSAADTQLVKAALQDLGESGQKVLDRLENAAQRPSLGIKALNEASREAKGSLEAMGESLGVAGRVMQAMGPGGIAAAAGIGLTVEALKKMVEAAADGELATAKINGMLAATGSASGKTAEQLEELANALSTTTLATKEQLLGAETQLLAFHSVMGKTFDDTIALAQDLATSGFGSLAENAVRLGRVLEDPANNLEALRRAGILFSSDLKEQIKTLESSGQHFEAQRLIIEDLTSKVGGTGAAAGNTLTGAFHAFGQTYVEALEAAGKRQGILKYIADGFRAITDAMAGVTKSDLDRALSSLADLQAKLADAQKRNADAGVIANYRERIADTQNYINAKKGELEAEDRLARKKADIAQQEIAADALRTNADDLLSEALKTLKASSDSALASDKDITDGYLKGLVARTNLIDALGIEADAKHRLMTATLMGADAVDAENLALEIEANLRKAGRAASSDEVKAIIDKTTAIHNYKAAIEDLNGQQAAARKAAEDAQRAAEEQARAIQKFAEDAGAHVIDAFFSMAEGAKRPFDALLHYAEQTFAKIAAEAILNPIIVPIITQAVGGIAGYGGAPGFSAVGGSIGGSGGAAGGLATGALALNGSLGASLANSINVFGANTLGLGTGTTSLSAFGSNSLAASQIGATSLSGYLGAAGLGYMAGNIWASVTGGNRTVSSIGGTAAGIALAAGQPEIAAAIAAIAAIGSLFGPGPSDMQEGYQFNPITGTNSQVGALPGSKKYSQQNLSNASNFMSTISNFTQGIAKATGGTYAGGNIGFDTGNRDGSHLYFYGAGGGGQTQFDSPQDALTYAMQRITTLFTGLPADVETAFKSIDWTGDLQKNMSLVEFAATFQDNIKAMMDGTLSIQDDAYTKASAQVQSYIAQIRDFKATTEQLGLDAGKANEATKSFVERLVGLKDDAGPQSPLAQAIETLKGTFAAIGPLLKEVGLDTVDTSELLKRAIVNLGAPVVQNLQSRIFAGQGRDYINGVNSALWQEGTDIGNLSQLGMSPDLAVQALHGALSGIFSGLNADQLRDIMTTFKDFPDVVADATAALDKLGTGITQTLTVAVPTLLKQAAQEQVNAVNQQISAATTLQAFFRNAQSALKQSAFGLDFNPATSALNPMDALNLLQSQFSSDSALARLGNQTAISGLGDEGTQLVTLAKQVYGSTDKFVAIQQQVKQTFNDVADIAGRQADIAGQQLDVLNKQLLELTKISNSLAFGGSGAKTFTGADLDALNASYLSEYNRAVGGGMSEAGFVSSPEFGLFEKTLLQEIGGLNDVDRLRGDLPYQEGRFADPLYGASSQANAEAMVARLVQLLAPNDAIAQGMVAHLEGMRGDISGLTSEIQNILIRLPRAR